MGSRGAEPILREESGARVAAHGELGACTLSCEGATGLLSTENETNAQRLWGQPNPLAERIVREQVGGTR